MKYRTLGRTGVEVSELIFGCGNVGGLLIRGEPDRMRDGVRRALDGGINWFDTSAAYGDGKSEESLGWLLEEVEETPYVSTKVRLDTSRLDDVQGQIQKTVEESLKRLRMERVDLLHLHNPVAPETGGRAVAKEEVTREGGIADALERVRDQGLTRFIGFTALGEAESCRHAVDSGRFDVVQVYYNMLNPSAARDMPPAWKGQDFKRLIDSCRAKDVGVIAIRIFAAGYLATDVRHGRESILTSNTEAASEERMAGAVFEALGPELGTWAQIAIRFILSNPDIASANFGASDPWQVDEALGGVDLGPLPAEAIERLDGLYRTDFGAAG